MTDRNEKFAGDDPIALARNWLDAARATELNDPDAISLATVDAQGRPNVRVVLLKKIEHDAFVFYTNYESRKAQELDAAGSAAFVLHHKSLRQQIRVRGVVSKENGADADAYYASRSVQSRQGAWASRQSQPLGSREELVSAFEAVVEKYGDTPPRPPFWGGYRIQPLEIEFWSDGSHRLHDRFRWSRSTMDEAWTTVRLNP